MKNLLTISVDQPCSENWNTFTPTTNGGHCHRCQKEVIDFTNMSREDLVTWFAQGNRACGRFRKNQLRTYHLRSAQKSRTGIRWAFACLLSVLVMTSTMELRAMDLTSIEITAESSSQLPVLKTEKAVRQVSGLVKDENGETMPGVNVYLKESNYGTVTDIEGRFTFPRELSAGDILIFSFIGYETLEYKVSEKQDTTIEIAMVMVADITGEVIVVGGATAYQSVFGRLWSGVRRIFN